MSALAKATIRDGSEGIAAAARADRNLGDWLRKTLLTVVLLNRLQKQ